MDLNINLRQETTTNNLPNETEDQVLSPLNDIRGADVDHRASNVFRRCDNNVVVLCHLESVQRLLRSGLVQYTSINRVWYGVVDQPTEDETISDFVEQLHGVCGDRDPTPYGRVCLEHL